MNWGTVCDDNFGEKEATVACRQIADAYGLKSGEIVDWNGKGGNEGNTNQAIWLDNLDCNGDETRIVDCDHSGWGNHDCSHIEDQFIECSFEHDNSVVVHECIDCSLEPGWVAVQNGEEFFCEEVEGVGAWIDSALNSVPLIVFVLIGVIMLCVTIKRARAGGCCCCCERRRNNSVLAGRSNSIRGGAAGGEGGGQSWIANAAWSIRGGLTASVREMSWRNRGSTYWGGAGQEPPIVIATPMHGGEPINAITAHTRL